MCLFFFFKQKTAYEMRISDWSSDVCSSDLAAGTAQHAAIGEREVGLQQAIVPGLRLGFDADARHREFAILLEQPDRHALANFLVFGLTRQAAVLVPRHTLAQLPCGQRHCVPLIGWGYTRPPRRNIRA